MFRELCEQRRQLRRNIVTGLIVPKNVQAESFSDRRKGVAERTSIIASNIESRSNHRLAQNAEYRSTMYEQGLADAERVRTEATIKVNPCKIAAYTFQTVHTYAGAQVERYTRAEHLLHEPALLRLTDLDRERRIYSEAAALIRNTPLMADIDAAVALQALKEIPKESPRKQAQTAASRAYIALRSKAAKR